MFIEFSHAVSLEFGRKRLSEADILELVADSEDNITEVIEPKGPIGFVKNPETD